MTTGTYAPRTPVHDTRSGAVKTQGPNLWAVLHTSEGAESTSSAEQLAAFMALPATATNVASYHVVFDTDRIIPAVPYAVVAYSAGGGNARGVHGCFPGRAGQTRAQWLDADSRPMIRQAAAWLVDVAALGIPLVRIGPDDVAAYRSGVCDHFDITRAFRKSTHTDVGPGFPWDVLWSDVDQLLAPKEDDMPKPTDVYVTVPPPERKGGPYFITERFGGSTRYAGDWSNVMEIPDHRVPSPEQYDLIRKEVGV